VGQVVRLSIPQSDGATLREHLQAAYRMTGRADPALLERPPPGSDVLLQAFYALHSTRQEGGAIPQTEIAAYQANQGLRLSAWELDTLAAMDNAAMRALHEHAKGQRHARRNP